MADTEILVDMPAHLLEDLDRLMTKRGFATREATLLDALVRRVEAERNRTDATDD